MNNKLKIFFFGVWGLLSGVFLYSQDLHMSQFNETPLLRNPALAGIFTGDVRVNAVYRDQWNSVTAGYRTGSLSGEYKMSVGNDDDFITLGMQLFYDRAGSVSFTQTKVLPALNYHKSISSEKNTYLSLGFMGGWVQHSIDLSKVTTNSQYEGMGIGEGALAQPDWCHGIDGAPAGLVVRPWREFAGAV